MRIRVINGVAFFLAAAAPLFVAGCKKTVGAAGGGRDARRPDAGDDARYTNISTAPNYVWFYLVNAETGQRMEVVAENPTARCVLGPEVGVDRGDGDAWRDFMRVHEGREVTASAKTCAQFKYWNVARLAVPADLAGAEKLPRDEFIAKYFEKTEFGTVPRVYKTPQTPGALVFVKYCILQRVNVRRGCEVSYLYLDGE